MLISLQFNKGIYCLNYKSWRSWVSASPSSLKWFIYLILFKPILDVFYFVKEGGFLSPSQIIGFLTFVISAFCILIRANKNSSFKTQDFSMLIFGALLIINAFLVYFVELRVKEIGEFIRIIVPVILFFFLRNEIKNVTDVNGLLFTYLLSSIFPYALLLYEFFFQPFRIEELSESRGGGIRLTGLYADMFNYMSYIIGDFLIISLYFTNKVFFKLKPSIISILFFLALSIIGMLGIKHQASWSVLVCLLILFLIFNRGNKSGRTVAFIMIILFFIGSGFLWSEYIAPLFAKELNVYSGETDQSSALNGRIVRWEQYFSIWNKMDVSSQAFGVGFSGHDAAYIMMSGGMHSDYVRFLFSTGIVGILFYLLFYVSALLNSFRKPLQIKFFVTASAMILMMYAVSSNPFGASGALLYLVLIGLVLATKPPNFLFIKNAK